MLRCGGSCAQATIAGHAYEDAVKQSFVKSSQRQVHSRCVEIDSLIGSDVEICSISGIAYRGVVNSIRDKEDLGELFELASAHDPTYRRLVYVVDRCAQIRHIEDGG